MKQAIALAGGGTKGAYQVGAWKAMRELGIPFDIVTGTSIGSVTAALMVQDDFERAWELWTHITEEQIMLERDDATPHEKHELAALAEHPEQLIARVKDWADLNRRTADISPYRALVHKYLDEERFFASPVDFGLMTARFPSFQPVEVRKRDIAPGYLPQWILASSACFPMFPMCEIDGQNYLDGAYSDNLPISTAFRLGADRVIAIGLKPETPEKKYANHPLVTYIAPAEPLGKLLEFDPDAMRHSIALGLHGHAARARQPYRPYLHVCARRTDAARRRRARLSALAAAPGADAAGLHAGLFPQRYTADRPHPQRPPRRPDGLRARGRGVCAGGICLSARGDLRSQAPAAGAGHAPYGG